MHALIINGDPEGMALHVSRQDARADLAAYAREFWHQIAGHDQARQDGIPDTPAGLGDDAVISTYFARRPDETWSITPAALPDAPVPMKFRLDEQAALAFLDRAQRRWEGTLGLRDPESPEGEHWKLDPEWHPKTAGGNKAGRAQSLVYEAIYIAEAMALPAKTAELDLRVDMGPAGPHGYDWTVGFAGIPFGLSTRYQYHFGGLGSRYRKDGDLALGEGKAVALAILREAEAAGNEALSAHALSRGRTPADLPRFVSRPRTPPAVAQARRRRHGR